MSSDPFLGMFSHEQVNAVFRKTTGRSTPPSYHVLIDFFSLVDPAIMASRYVFSPAKSSEFGKIDQPMLNHIRNGIWALVELNNLLSEMGSDAMLSSDELREAIALFAIHDIHKCVERDWKEQFDISADFAYTIAAEFQLTNFAPTLKSADYQSVACGLHSNSGFHADLSQKFTDYLRWLKLADALASQERPQVSGSLRKALDAVDPELSFYYHRFQESTGILSNLVHTGIAEWAKRKGVYPFLVFETGVLYVGPKGVDLGASDSVTVTEIYREFEYVLNSCHAAISDPKELSKSITVQGSKGLYSIEEASFFYSGIPTVMKGFMAAAVLREEQENKTPIEIDLERHTLLVKKAEPEIQHPPVEIIDIPRSAITRIEIDGAAVEPADIEIICQRNQKTLQKYVIVPESVRLGGKSVEGTQIRIIGTGLFSSQVGYRHHIRADFGIDIGWDAQIISYARAIAGLRKEIIDPLTTAGVLPTTDPIIETCRLLQIDADLAAHMADYASSHRSKDHHATGGFWNYGYVIARSLLDSSIDGVRFANLTTDRKIARLSSLVDSFLSGISEEVMDSFKTRLLYPYQDKLLVWFAENLDLNGSMAFGVFENKVSKFDAYCRGKGICRLTADTPFQRM